MNVCLIKLLLLHLDYTSIFSTFISWEWRMTWSLSRWKARNRTFGDDNCWRMCVSRVSPEWRQINFQYHFHPIQDTSVIFCLHDRTRNDKHDKHIWRITRTSWLFWCNTIKIIPQSISMIENILHLRLQKFNTLTHHTHHVHWNNGNGNITIKLNLFWLGSKCTRDVWRLNLTFPYWEKISNLELIN